MTNNFHILVLITTLCLELRALMIITTTTECKCPYVYFAIFGVFLSGQWFTDSSRPWYPKLSNHVMQVLLIFIMSARLFASPWSFSFHHILWFEYHLRFIYYYFLTVSNFPVVKWQISLFWIVLGYLLSMPLMRILLTSWMNQGFCAEWVQSMTTIMSMHWRDYSVLNLTN